MTLSGWCGQRGIPDCEGCKRRGATCDHDCHDLDEPARQLETVSLTNAVL